MSNLRTVVVIVGVLAGSAAAQPADPAAGRDAYDAGRRAFATKDYETAIVEFRRAFALDPDPGYLFDHAQAARMAKHCADAAALYRQFLTLVPAPPNRPRIEQWIAEADACATPAAPPPEPSSPHVTPPMVVQHREPIALDRGRHQRHLAYAIGGAGLGLLVAESALGIIGKRGYDDAATPAARDRWRDIVRYGGTSMAVVGAAALGAAVWLYATSPVTRTELAPAVAPGYGGITLSRSF
jgi:tetratricopeptide (TPR) repeat protein